MPHQGTAAEVKAKASAQNRRQIDAARAATGSSSSATNTTGTTRSLAPVLPSGRRSITQNVRGPGTSTSPGLFFAGERDPLQDLLDSARRSGVDLASQGRNRDFVIDPNTGRSLGRRSLFAPDPRFQSALDQTRLPFAVNTDQARRQRAESEIQAEEDAQTREVESRESSALGIFSRELLGSGGFGVTVRGGGGPGGRDVTGRFPISSDPEIAKLQQESAQLLSTAAGKNAGQNLQRTIESLVRQRFEESQEGQNFLAEKEDVASKQEASRETKKETSFQKFLKREQEETFGRSGNTGGFETEDEEDDEDRVESSLLRVIELANEQRDKEFGRAEESRNNEIARIEAERKVSEGKLRKDIKAREKTELDRLAAGGKLRTTAKGKILLSSDDLVSDVQIDFRTELREGMDEIANLFNQSRAKIVSDFDTSVTGIEDNRFSVLRDVESERIRIQQELQERQDEVQKDLEDNQINFADTLESFTQLIRDNPENIELFASQLRQDLISLGITDPTRLDNAINSMRALAKKTLREDTSFTEQRERSNIPREIATAFEKLSAGARNILVDIGRDISAIQALDADQLKDIGATNTDKAKAIDFLREQSKGASSSGGSKSSVDEEIENFFRQGIESGNINPNA